MITNVFRTFKKTSAAGLRIYERNIPEVKNGSNLESCPLLAQGKGLELSGGRYDHRKGLLTSFDMVHFGSGIKRYPRTLILHLSRFPNRRDYHLEPHGLIGDGS